MFASLLRMTAKYGYSNVRDQLFKDLRGAYPTKWEAYQAAEVLDEDIFEPPKPHPNAVLNLFLEQNVRFALPFAAYRASIAGSFALMSDKPGTVLPRHAIATTTHGTHLVRGFMDQAARVGNDFQACFRPRRLGGSVIGCSCSRSRVFFCFSLELQSTYKKVA